jgi:hypothetical protein
LRCKAPARQVLADGAYLQPQTKFLLDELTDRSTAPQAEIHLQLFWARVDDQALNGLLSFPVSD